MFLKHRGLVETALLSGLLLALVACREPVQIFSKTHVVLSGPEYLHTITMLTDAEFERDAILKRFGEVTTEAVERRRRLVWAVLTTDQGYWEPFELEGGRHFLGLSPAKVAELLFIDGKTSIWIKDGSNVFETAGRPNPRDGLGMPTGFYLRGFGGGGARSLSVLVTKLGGVPTEAEGEMLLRHFGLRFGALASTVVVRSDGVFEGGEVTVNMRGYSSGLSAAAWRRASFVTCRVGNHPNCRVTSIERERQDGEREVLRNLAGSTGRHK
jgi:hypothetical protein